MHMADALVSPAIATTMYAASAVAATVSVKKLNKEQDESKIPVMGVMGAFVFATQMVNFTMPGAGSSGHVCGGMLLSAILGPYAGFLTMICVLLTQCLFFADGGLMALGCNVWNMAFYGCFIGSMCIWKPIMKNGRNKKKIILASILGCVLTLQMGAFSVCIQTLGSGITELPFSVFVMAMQPIHLAIGFVEGLITATVLCFIYEARPEYLYLEGKQKEGKLAPSKTITVLAVISAFIGGRLSLFASEFPDGLEWSIERLTGATELDAFGGIYELFAGIQDKLAFLPDYAFKSSETRLGTTVSGLVGAVIVALVCLCISMLIKKTRRHE